MEAREIAKVVRRLRDAGVAVLLVEHNMEFVMDLSDTVTVLDFGNPIASGTPKTIQRDPAVLHAYLGTEAIQA
jgi:branched-chain amino acid transport system ATP-binding protein/branched-chain amino acid transport system permease protein